MNQDILDIDSLIKSNFEEQKKILPTYEKELTQLRNIKNIETLSARIRNDIKSRIIKVSEKIEDIKRETSYNFYIAESFPLIEEYKEILKQPVRVNFMKKKPVENPEKNKIINEYFYIAKKYINLKLDINKTVNKKIICESCDSKTFDIIENNYICKNCGTIQEFEVQSTSYADIDRVNMSTKYSYDRKIHFSDCIHQYQGKQNCTIDKKIYEDLEKQLDLHKLLIGNINTPKDIRFKNITKFHIATFLKEINYDKYENINLIHWKLTGKKPDDISYLEEKLMEDFTTLVKIYYVIYKDENKVERSSFINTQHIFYQLLLKYNHPCNKEDFSLLKTTERLAFHDSICEDLFKILEWNYTSFY
jgi:hypothetical protein